jgi:hypothetical protein
MAATVEKEAAEYLNLLKKLEPHEHDALVSSIKKIKDSLIDNSEKSDSLIEDLTYRSYSEAEKIKLEMDSLYNYFQRRRELLHNSLTTSQVAQLLGTSRQTPHDRVKNKTLLAVRDNGVLRFPAWQFEPEGPDGVIDGLPEVLKSLSISSDFAKLNWFMRPNSVLDGLTPVQALKQGLKTRVIEEAMGVGGASW